jgi:hypothetical protein
MISIRKCKAADEEHKISKRQYAHVHHIKGDIICVARDWVNLPIDTEMGLIAHEIGHLLAGNIAHSEEEADKLANKFFKITIRYRNTLHGNNLQYLNYSDTMKVYNWVINNVKFEGRIFA